MPDPASPVPILDHQGTLDRLKGDAEFLETLYGVFAEDLPLKLAVLEQASAAGDLTVLQRTAHSLKGAAATVGALALRDAAFALETATRAQDLSQAPDLLAAVRTQAERTQAAIATATA